MIEVYKAIHSLEKVTGKKKIFCRLFCRQRSGRNKVEYAKAGDFLVTKKLCAMLLL